LIKKVGVVCAILSLMSMTSAPQELTECEILGVEAHHLFLRAGFDHYAAYLMSEGVQEQCELTR